MKKQKTGLLPVSQRSLALYLRVSSTLLNMTETGRHGTRQLSDTASNKRMELLLVHQQSQQSNTSHALHKKIQGHLATDNARLVKAMSQEAKDADHQVTGLRKKLEDMIRNEQRDIQWLNTLELLLSKLPATKDAAKDRVWLDYQQVIVLKRLKKNGWVAQVKLEAQIEMNKARALVSRDAVKNLLKK